MALQFDKKLKDLRQYYDYSQYKVAELMGISRNTYKGYEEARDIVPTIRLNDLANIFNCSIDYILDLTSEKEYSCSSETINFDLCKKRLKEFRKENKLTQNKLSQILNISQSTVAYFEKGRNLIATPFLYDICKKYGISADYLLGKVDSPKYIKK